MQSDDSASSETTRRPVRLASSSSTTTPRYGSSVRPICSSTATRCSRQPNGQEGLELALDHVPDVVLLEISMPVLDGFGLAAALQANERTRELPLIFLTTEDDPAIKAKAFETGAHAVITKPFEPHAVTSFIERVVAQVVPRRRLSVVDPRAGTPSKKPPNRRGAAGRRSARSRPSAPARPGSARVHPRGP